MTEVTKNVCQTKIVTEVTKNVIEVTKNVTEVTKHVFGTNSMAVYGRVASYGSINCGLISHYIALYCIILRLISPFLAVIDPNSFGLVLP